MGSSIPPDLKREELEVQLRLAAIALLEYSQAGSFMLEIATGDNEPYLLVMGMAEDARRLLAFEHPPNAGNPLGTTH